MAWKFSDGGEIADGDGKRKSEHRAGFRMSIFPWSADVVGGVGRWNRSIVYSVSYSRRGDSFRFVGPLGCWSVGTLNGSLLSPNILSDGCPRQAFILYPVSSMAPNPIGTLQDKSPDYPSCTGSCTQCDIVLYSRHGIPKISYYGLR